MASNTTSQLAQDGEDVALNRLLLAELRKLNGLLAQMQRDKSVRTKEVTADDDDNNSSDLGNPVEDVDEANNDGVASVLPYLAMSPSQLTSWAVNALRDLKDFGLAGPRPTVHFVTSRGESVNMKWQDFYDPPEGHKLDVKEQWDRMLSVRLGARNVEWKPARGDGDSVVFRWYASTLFSDRKIRSDIASWAYDHPGSIENVTARAYLLPSSIIVDLKKPYDPLHYRGDRDWVYGREWSVHFGNNCLVPWEVVLFILVHTAAFPTYVNIHHARLPALSFAMPWEDSNLTSPYHYIDSDLWIQHFHIRCLRVIPPHYKWSDSDKVNGVKLTRALWEEKTTFLNPHKRLRLREIRMLIAIRTQRGRNRPYFTTIRLTDGIYDDWDKDGLLPARRDIVFPKGPMAPVATFQDGISRILEKWACCWRGVLDEIDQVVSVKAEEALTEQWVEDHMFDDSFEMTARYPSMLQLLRIIPTWIDNSSKDVDTLCDIKGGNDIVKKNMATLRRQKDKLVDELKTRIKQKVDEIESLRSGIFNATSLKGASTSRVMKSYLFIFTVMTIFYLPLSFVTSIFGMHLFDYSEVTATQRSFYITIVLAAVLTYVAALVAVLAAAPKGDKDGLWNQLSAQLRTLRREETEGKQQGLNGERGAEGHLTENEERRGSQQGMQDEKGKGKEKEEV